MPHTKSSSMRYTNGLKEPVPLPQILSMLSDKVKEMGSQHALAIDIGITPTHLGDVLNGRRKPGPKILRALGLRREMIFIKDSMNGHKMNNNSRGEGGGH